MPTTAVRFRGGWVLLVTGTLQPGAVGPFEHLYGEDPTGAAIDITTDSTVTLTVAQILQQWESSSGNLLCPLAFTEQELENKRVALGLDAITATSALVPLPKIYAGAGGGDATTLQGTPISAVAPTLGQALAYNGADWIGGGWNKGPQFVVGNALQGDTRLVCDYLDAGDGVQLQAALTAAGAATPKLDVWVRPGNYTLATMLTIPSLVTMRCSGWGTIFNVTATQRKAFLLSASSSMEDVSIVVPVPALGATGAEVVEVGTNSWMKRCRVVMTAQTAPQAANESLTAGVRTSATGAALHASYVTLTMISFRALAIAADMIGFACESILGASCTVLSDTRVQGADIGYDVKGAVQVIGWHANAVRRIGVRAASTNLAGAQRDGAVITAGHARLLALAGTPQFGIVFDTGTDAAGMISANASNCRLFTTSVEATSAAISLVGLGVGACVDNVSSDSFPVGMSVAIGQTNARGANLTIRSSTTPTADASGSALFPNAQVF